MTISQIVSVLTWVIVFMTKPIEARRMGHYKSGSLPLRQLLDLAAQTQAEAEVLWDDDSNSKIVVTKDFSLIHIRVVTAEAEVIKRGIALLGAKHNNRHFRDVLAIQSPAVAEYISGVIRDADIDCSKEGDVSIRITVPVN